MEFRLPTLNTRRCRPRRRGFSLVEAAFCTLIAGTATVATLQLMTAGTLANTETSELTTAVNLAENVHELTLKKTFAEVVALKGSSYSPPLNFDGNYCTELGSTWKQAVAIAYLTPADITTTTATATTVARVTVTVSHNNSPVHSLSWIITNTATP